MIYLISIQIDSFVTIKIIFIENKVWHTLCHIVIVMKKCDSRLVTDNYKRFHYDWLVS